MNTGGPAFPGPYVTEKGALEAVWKQGGMTLRDYFAAKAMQALTINKSFVQLYSAGSSAIAQQAYIVADAMLKAREQ